MSTITHDFTVGDRPEITVALAAADVTVIEGPAGTIRVEAEGPERELAQLDIFQTGDVITVRSLTKGSVWGRRGLTLRILAAAGVAFAGHTASGDFRILVAVSDFDFVSASGDVHLASFNGRARAKTASGDLVVGEASGRLQVGSASGDVRVDSFEGDAQINTASGDVAIGTAVGSVSVKTASGDTSVRRFSGASFEGATMSGDFDIGLVPGMSIDADLQTVSGSFRNLVPAGGGEKTIKTSMRIKTLSGDIVLR
jgi:hypothetical protein